MKYLVTMTLATTTFAIALLIGGFDSTLVYAGESDEENCMAITDWDEHYACWERNQTDTAKIDGIEPVLGNLLKATKTDIMIACGV